MHKKSILCYEPSNTYHLCLLMWHLFTVWLSVCVYTFSFQEFRNLVWSPSYFHITYLSVLHVVTQGQKSR